MAEGSLEGAESIGGLVAEVQVDNTAFKAKLKDIRSDIKDTANEADKQTSKIKEFFEKLRSQGGRRSSLGEFAELLHGGGAVIGVTLLGKALAEVTGKAAELNEQFRKGQIDATGMAVGIAKTIPVIGGFVEAGQNIREMITHEKADMEEITEETKVQLELLKQKVEVARQVREELRGWSLETVSFQDKLRLLMAHTEVEKRKVEVDIDYKAKTEELAHDLDKQIQDRTDKLKTETQTIADSYKDRLTAAMNEASQEHYDVEGVHRPELDKAAQDQLTLLKNQKDAEINAASNKATGPLGDIEKLKADAKAVQDVLDKLHTEGVKDADGIREAMKKLTEEVGDKLAVTANEKIENYRTKMLAAGYDSKQAATLAAKFGETLKAEKTAAYTQSLEDLHKQLLTLGGSSKETAINLAMLNLQTKDPEKVKDYAKAWQEVHDAMKKQEGGDELISMQEQIAEWGATPLEAVHNKILFLTKDAKLANDAVKLEVKIEGQEKVTELSSALKNIKDHADDAGKSDIQKQVDQWKRWADAGGKLSEYLPKIAEAEHQLEVNKVKDFVKQTEDETAEIGLSEPDKAVARLKAQGVTDPNLVGPAWEAAAKKAGKELGLAVETPLQKYQKQIADLNQLLNHNAIDQQTYLRAQQQDFQQYASSIKGSSVEEAFKSNLRKQLLPGFQADLDKKTAAKKEADNRKALLEAAKHQANAADANTDAIKDLTDTLQNGVAFGLA